MTAEQIQQSLQDYAVAYEAGQISRDEYKSLLEGLEVEKMAAETAEELAHKEELNKYITTTINIISAVA